MALLSSRLLVHIFVALLVLGAGASASRLALLTRAPLPHAAGASRGADLRPIPVAPAPGVAAVAEALAPMLHDPQPGYTDTFPTYHRLAAGETLGDVAARYRVSVASLYWANGLHDGLLLADQELRVPRVSGVPYVVQPDDTLEQIAARFHVPPEAILLFKPNQLEAGAPLEVGREIFIPGGVLPYPAELLARFGDERGIAAIRAAPAGSVRDSETNLRSGPGRAYPRLALLDAGQLLRPVARYADWVQVDVGGGDLGWVRSDLLALPPDLFATLPETFDFPPPPPRWVWPTHGQISSWFGWRRVPFRSFHNGIDIANRAGTPILAARAGRVIEAGWCSGFGYCVKIDHGGGVVTIYGHMLRRPLVSVGDEVEAGERIGAMGSTYDRAGGGYTTGVHLHFTVKVDGKTVDPLQFLP